MILILKQMVCSYSDNEYNYYHTMIFIIYMTIFFCLMIIMVQVTVMIIDITLVLRTEFLLPAPGSVAKYSLNTTITSIGKKRKADDDEVFTLSVSGCLSL